MAFLFSFLSIVPKVSAKKKYNWFVKIRTHCYHVNDFPVVNGTTGIIQDPIDLLLAKCNFTIKRWMVLVFSTCNTIHLLLVKLHFANKRRMVLVFSTCNTIHLLLVKFHLLFQIFLLIDTKKVNHLHDNNVNTEAKPRWYRVKLLYVPLN